MRSSENSFPASVSFDQTGGSLRPLWPGILFDDTCLPDLYNTKDQLKWKLTGKDGYTMKKRLICLFLSIAMCLSLMPFKVLADAEPIISEETAFTNNEPAEEAAEESGAEESAEEFAEEPSEEAAEEPAAEEAAGAEESVEEAAEGPAEEAVEEPSAEESAEELAEEHSEEAAEKPAAEEGSEKPEKKAPAEKHIEEAEAEADAGTERSSEKTEEAVPGMAAGAVASGTCGSGVSWTLTDNYVLTISGSGAMSNYISVPNVPWSSYRTEIRSIVIQEGVTGIGENAFYDCTNLTSVSLPDSLQSIEGMAFERCTALSVITIPANVTNVKFSAFSGCTGLEKVFFTGPAPTIGSGAFNGVTATIYYHDLSGWNTVAGQNYGGTLTWICRYSFECGDNMTWAMSSGGKLTIQGNGPMWDFDYDIPPWDSVKESIQSVEIYDGPVSIGNNAFRDCTELYSVSLPTTIESIGDSAFRNCTSLNKVIIPNRTDTIGKYAFYNCANLETADLGYVESIGDYAFIYCSSLKEINFPPELSIIPREGFYQCSSLASVTFSSGVTRIQTRAFADCTSLTEITFKGDAPDISTDDTFRGVTATAWYPPTEGWTSEKRQNYGGTLTWRCKNECGDNLTWNLAGGVLTITGTGDMWDFSRSDIPWQGIDITSVVIRNGVTGIGKNAFWNCKTVTGITIPDTVTRIGNSAFASCSALANLSTISARVTFIGEEAFESCQSLAAIPVASGNPNYVTVDGVLFNKNRTVLLQYPAGKPGEGYAVPAGVADIAPYAFGYCFQLTNVTIPEGVASIGNNAFWNCTNLTGMDIPASVNSLGHSAFYNCSKLESVTFLGEAPAFDGSPFFFCTLTAWYPLGTRTWTDEVMQQYGGTVTWKGYQPSGGACGDNLTWSIEDSVLTISGTGAMWDFDEMNPGWYELRDSITSVVFENSVTGIGKSAFMTCGHLKSVTIPAAMTVIGDAAFAGCASLTDVTIPASVTDIGYGAFAGCMSLTAITVASGNSNYTSADGVLFNKNKTGLIQYPAGKTSTAYMIPTGVTWIESTAFYLCTKLTSLVIPSGMQQIREAAVAYCSALKSISFRGNAPAIGDAAFENVTAAAYYPADNSTWTEAVMQDYGGTITWTGLGDKPVLTLSASTKGVGLTWAGCAGASRYQIQRRIKGETKGVGVNTTEPVYTDGTVSMGETYIYRVRGYAGGAWKEWSDEQTILFNPFTDVSGNKTIKNVGWAFNNGIVTGTSETTFSPNDNCTRIQFIMMLWKLNGSKEVGGANPFKDISGNKTTKAILWALDAGIINSGETFNPNDPISRVQVVLILWKMAGSPNASGNIPFTDVSGKKTINAVSWAYDKKITSGTSATTFSPNDNCTRVQLVFFLKSYNDIYKLI